MLAISLAVWNALMWIRLQDFRLLFLSNKRQPIRIHVLRLARPQKFTIICVLLYARAGIAYSYMSGEAMIKYTEERVVEMILADYANQGIYILAPLVRNRKGHYRELFEQMRRKGYLYIRIDGEILEITRGMKVDRYKNHNIEVVIDKLKLGAADDETLKERLAKTVSVAMKQGDSLIMIVEKESGEAKYFSKRLMDPITGIAYKDPAPNIFSFNSPE